MRPLLIATAAWVVLFSPAPSGAGETRAKGEVALETRLFPNDSNPATEDEGLALFHRLEIDNKHGLWREKLRGFIRIDTQDEERRIQVFEEAWGEYKKDRFRVRAGVDVLNWTATEAFHPADIINSRNVDSDLENLEKIGEPMVAAAYQVGAGQIWAALMPFWTKFFMEPIIPSSRSRVSFIPPGLGLSDPVLLGEDGDVIKDGVVFQGAARYTQSIGSIDFGVQAVHHVDRSQPVVVFDPASGSVTPVLLTVTQVGGTFAQVLGPFILKLEAGHRIFELPESNMTVVGPIADRDHTQVAVGVEWGMSHANGWDSMWIAEAQNYFGASKSMRAALGVFQRDAMIGYRLALNDVNSSEWFLGVIGDLERSEEVMGFASYRQRLSDVWNVSTGLRLVHAPVNGPAPSGLQALDRSDQIRLTITRFF